MKIEEIMAPGFNPRPWLTGKCFDFALALHERMPDAEFVVIGSARMPDHVALRRNGVYYDVRGAIPDVRTFLAHHGQGWAGDPAELVEPISRDDVELHAGVAGFPPPYQGNRDIAAARRAVNAVYGRKRNPVIEATNRMALYHGSQAQLPVGTILRPQSAGYVTDTDGMVQQTERIVERYRPRNSIPRSQAVFMVADPGEIDYAGGYEDFIYQVEPVGKVERSDLAWYSEVGNSFWDDENDPEARQYAEAYWAGTPFKNAANSLWEYRARSARILRIFSQLD